MQVEFLFPTYFIISLIWLLSLLFNTVGSSVRTSETDKYEAMDFAEMPSPEAEDPDVYLTIPDSVVSPQHESTKPTSDSAIERDAFAQKLATMTDEDLLLQFQVRI